MHGPLSLNIVAKTKIVEIVIINKQGGCRGGATAPIFKASNALLLIKVE